MGLQLLLLGRRLVDDPAVAGAQVEGGPDPGGCGDAELGTDGAVVGLEGVLLEVGQVGDAEVEFLEGLLDPGSHRQLLPDVVDELVLVDEPRRVLDPARH